MRVCYLPLGEIGRKLEADPCPEHGKSLPATAFDHCKTCQARWNRLCDSDKTDEGIPVDIAIEMAEAKSRKARGHKDH